jgi:signal transduction histidine kinase
MNSMETQRFEVENENIRRHLNASFTLSGYLLEAHSEQAVILAAMRVSTELLGAQGSAFVPFNEWKQSLPALTFGEESFLKNENWQKCLSAPATRHACRICERKQASTDCILLEGVIQDQTVSCISLRCDGREIGVLSFFFYSQPNLNNDLQKFLAEMVRLTDLALVAQRAKNESETFPLARLPLNLREELIALDAKNAELLAQLEYQAILDERTRLSREIHDGLAQTLAFLKIETARMQAYALKGDHDAILRKLHACQKILSDAYLDARQAIDNLRQFPEETLADWLAMTAAEFTKLTEIEVDISKIQLQYTFSPGVKAQLVRIVQEALTNVRKHAQASAVTLSAVERNELVFLEVSDNGRGFSPEETKPASQYGLRSMRERAEAIGADYQIISKAGSGTNVRLQIPKRERASL